MWHITIYHDDVFSFCSYNITCAFKIWMHVMFTSCWSTHVQIGTPPIMQPTNIAFICFNMCFFFLLQNIYLPRSMCRAQYSYLKGIVENRTPFIILPNYLDFAPGFSFDGVVGIGLTWYITSLKTWTSFVNDNIFTKTFKNLVTWQRHV